MYESSISLIELLNFTISQLHVPQVRFLDFKNNIVLYQYFTISPIYRIGRFGCVWILWKLQELNRCCLLMTDSYKLVGEFHGQLKIGGGKKRVLLDWRENGKKKKKWAVRAIWKKSWNGIREKSKEKLFQKRVVRTKFDIYVFNQFDLYFQHMKIHEICLQTNIILRNVRKWHRLYMTFIEKVKTIYTFHKLVFDNEDNNLVFFCIRATHTNKGISRREEEHSLYP